MRLRSAALLLVALPLLPMPLAAVAAGDDLGDDIRDEDQKKRRGGDDDQPKRRRSGDDDLGPRKAAPPPSAKRRSPEPDEDAPAPRRGSRDDPPESNARPGQRAPEAPPSSSRKKHGLSTMVLVVPENREASTAATQLAALLEQTVAKHAGYDLIVAAEALAPTKLPTDASTAIAKANAELAKGKEKLNQTKIEDAERSFRVAVGSYEVAAGWADPTADYGDALTHLAAALALKGEQDKAAEVFRQLATMDPGARIDASSGADPGLTAIFRDAKGSLGKLPRGTMSVYSNPPGGRVHVDGAFRGYTPLQLDRLTAGKHLLKVEKTGTYPYGEVVNISATEDLVVKAKLRETAEFAAIEERIENAGRELDSKDVGQNIEWLGHKLKLDRLVIARVKQAIDEATVDAAVVDFRSMRRLTKKHTAFQGDEFGGLEREVSAFAKRLLDDADSEGEKAPARSRDPLAARSGTEDWYDEDKGSADRGSERDGKRDDKKKKKGKDPLDHIDGMEDW